MDYYKILGVSHSASFAEIKAGYRLLSKRHHPDVGGDPHHMAHINQAYMVLSNPLKRSSYDARIRRQYTKLTPPKRQSSAWPTAKSAQTTPVKRRRKNLWWIIAAGLTSACFVVVGIIAMNSVRLAGPASNTEPANIKKPALAVQIPEDIPITAQTNAAEIAPTTTPSATSQAQPLAPTPRTTSSDNAQDSSCTSEGTGLFRFSRCRTVQGSAGCHETNQYKNHFRKWCDENKR